MIRPLKLLLIIRISAIFTTKKLVGLHDNKHVETPLRHEYSELVVTTCSRKNHGSFYFLKSASLLY